MSKQSQLQRLLVKGEGPKVDFKQSLDLASKNAKAEFIKDVLAIANTPGTLGHLLFGVDDNGRPNDQFSSAVTEERIQQVIGQYTEPYVDVTYKTTEISGVNVGVLCIRRKAQKVPYRVRKSVGGDDKLIDQDEIFYRYGRHSTRARHSEVLSLVREGDGVRAYSEVADLIRAKHPQTVEAIRAAPKMAILIDGAYLGFVLKNEFGGAKVDFSALSQKIAQGMDILRTYYYNCPPYQGAEPTVMERKRIGAAQRFFAAIKLLPRFELRLGKVVTRGVGPTGKPIMQQKGIDIMLSTDLVQLSASRQITHVAIVAGDSDFVAPVLAAKDVGVTIRLYHGEACPRQLLEAADEHHRLNSDFIRSVAFGSTPPGL